MTAIDSLTAAIGAALERMREAELGAKASRECAEELRGRFGRLGADGKSGRVEGITAEIETVLARLRAGIELAEATLARTEALRGAGGAGAASGVARPPEPAGGSGYPRHRPHTISWSDLHHVLNGDPDDPDKGGHAYGTGRAEKTEFPQDWDDEDIKEALIEVASRPSKITDKPDKIWFATGVVRGVTVRAVVRADGSVAAGWPLAGPRVRTNPERRR